MPADPYEPQPPYAWQTCLDVEAQDAGHYLDFVNEPLLQLVSPAPRRVLELGCATGAFGAALKQRFPGAAVVGVEPNRAAAAEAAKRLDRVIVKRLEGLDLAAEGCAPGEFDCVIAADVLEHVANPWDVLVRLKPFLAPDAQVCASIPNVRNLVLAAALLDDGRFLYRERGLLDITHLRFFTVTEIRQMFEQTGYRYEGYGAVVSPALVETWRANKDQPVINLRFGRLSLTGLTPEELREMCAEMLLVRARPA